MPEEANRVGELSFDKQTDEVLTTDTSEVIGSANQYELFAPEKRRSHQIIQAVKQELELNQDSNNVFKQGFAKRWLEVARTERTIGLDAINSLDTALSLYHQGEKESPEYRPDFYLDLVLELQHAGRAEEAVRYFQKDIIVTPLNSRNIARARKYLEVQLALGLDISRIDTVIRHHLGETTADYAAVEGAELDVVLGEKSAAIEKLLNLYTKYQDKPGSTSTYLRVMLMERLLQIRGSMIASSPLRGYDFTTPVLQDDNDRFYGAIEELYSVDNKRLMRHLGSLQITEAVRSLSRSYISADERKLHLMRAANYRHVVSYGLQVANAMQSRIPRQEAQLETAQSFWFEEHEAARLKPQDHSYMDYRQTSRHVAELGIPASESAPVTENLPVASLEPIDEPDQLPVPHPQKESDDSQASEAK